MLPREHRLTRGADFRRVLRRGARAGAEGVVVTVHLAPASHEAPPSHETAASHGTTASAGTATSLGTPPWRCGLIVAKTVGNAVVRHRTQRRLRHLMRDIVEAPEGPLAQIRPQATVTDDRRVDVVIRALPEITALDHPALEEQLSAALRRALGKALRRSTGIPGSRGGTGQR